MIDIRLGIVGGGVVGRAMARCYLEHVQEVRVYDVLKERRTHEIEQVLGCDVVFVCLPTPQKGQELALDTSVLEEFFSYAASFHGNSNIVIRSTVPVGFTYRMREEYGLANLVHSPEFLTARCAMVDAQCPSRNVIGYPDHVPIAEDTSQHPIYELYNRRWPHGQIFTTDSDTSEACKLIQNSFFATKVAVFNEFYNYCRAAGLDWRAVRDVLLSDGRIHSSHTQVPGPDGKHGFGGTCLPKDLACLVGLITSTMGDSGHAGVTKSAHLRNKIDRGRNG